MNLDQIIQYLMDTFGLTKEEATPIAPSFKPEKITAFRDQAAAVTKAQSDLATANENLNKEMVEWAEMKAVGDPKLAEMTSQIEATQLRAFQLEQALTRVATEHGIDPKTVLPSGEPAKEPVKKSADAPDLTRYATLEQVGGIADMLLTLPAELAAIEREHFDLTGEHLDLRPIVADFKTAASKKQSVDVRTLWETKHDIAAKRTAKATAAHTAEMTAAEERGYQRHASEAAIPGQHAAGHSAAPFRTTQYTGGSKLQRPQPGSRVQRAAAALATHAFAGGKKPAAAA